MASERKTNRRHFLQGKAAIHALTDVRWNVSADPAADATPEPARAARSPTCLVQIGRRAMACDFQVIINAGQHDGAVEAAVKALDAIDALEDQMSVFRQHSEVSLINRNAFGSAVTVEERLFRLLCRCADWNRCTDGAFDITTGPLAKLWGFHTRRGRFPLDEQVEEVLRSVGTEHLELDRSRQTICFRAFGVEINLGSVGKGYAIDQSAEILLDAGIEDFMIHGGHSSILARGSRSTADESCDWRVALRHPLRPEMRLAEIRLRDQALGTSGSGQQFFFHRGRRYGHVLDPRTGRPAEGVLSATVLATNAAEADALATAFFVMGVDATREYCAARSDLSAVLVRPGTRQGTVALESIGCEDRLSYLEAPDPDQ